MKSIIIRLSVISVLWGNCVMMGVLGLSKCHLGQIKIKSIFLFFSRGCLPKYLLQTDSFNRLFSFSRKRY